MPTHLSKRVLPKTDSRTAKPVPKKAGTKSNVIIVIGFKKKITEYSNTHESLAIPIMVCLCLSVIKLYRPYESMGVHSHSTNAPCHWLSHLSSSDKC